MRKALAAAALLTLVAPTALADPPPWAPAHGRRAHEEARYDRHGYYVEPRPIAADERIWRGDDGRYYCRRGNGTTGLVVGAATGAVIGSNLAGRGDRTLGAVLGAAGGALIGREIDRSTVRCR